MTHSANIALPVVAETLSISPSSPPMIVERGEMESAVPAIQLIHLFRLDGPREMGSVMRRPTGSRAISFHERGRSVE